MAHHHAEGGGEAGSINAPHVGPVSALVTILLIVGLVRMPWTHSRMFRRVVICSIPLALVSLFTGMSMTSNPIMIVLLIATAAVIAADDNAHEKTHPTNKKGTRK